MASRKRGREDGATGDAEERELPALGGAGAPAVSIVHGRDADDEEVEEEEEDIFAEAGRAAPTTAAADGKRPRTSTDLVVADASRSGALIVADASAAGLAPGRVSGLAAPTMVLEGHRGPIYGLEFSPDGAHIASASKDRSVLVWSVYGECRSTVELTGHKNAVSDVHWSSDSLSLYTASADKTAAIWDAESGARRRRYVGHAGYVHACAPARRGRELVATASDDGFCKVWDARQRTPVHSFAHEFPITSVVFADDSASVFTAGLDELIRQWDLRRGTTLLELKGHTNTVTSLALNAAGTHLASFAMDHTLRIWDVRPFVASERCTRVRGRPAPLRLFLPPLRLFLAHLTRRIDPLSLFSSSPLRRCSRVRCTMRSSSCSGVRGRRTASVWAPGRRTGWRSCGMWTRVAPCIASPGTRAS